VPSRVVAGRDAVVREVRAAAPLMAALAAPVTARAPWLTAVLNAGGAGLPMGDPTARHLAARLLDGRIGNVRSRGLVDDLDERTADGPVRRSTDPREIERWLPFLLDGLADARERSFLRAAARLHAAIGQLEVAVSAHGGVPYAALLTLVAGADRWPWWGRTADGAGLPTTPGAPLVALTVPSRGWPPLPALRSRSASG
jgi:hypothetical protein